MKSLKIISALFVLAFTAGALIAKPIPGPKGGRILTTEAPHAEFFVEKDHSAIVTFYDAALKPVAPGDQVINAVVEAKTGKMKIEFAKTATGFVSKTLLPEGDDYNIVVQIRASADAKPKNFRVYYEDKLCEECKRPEYACICEAK